MRDDDDGTDTISIDFGNFYSEECLSVDALPSHASKADDNDFVFLSTQKQGSWPRASPHRIVADLLSHDPSSWQKLV